MNTGWIKIYRSLLYWEWADVPEMVALWVRLIIRATHEDSQWHGVTISRGLNEARQWIERETE